MIVGTFTKKKGIIVSLKTIQRVIEQNPTVSIKISLVGDAQNSEESRLTKNKILNLIENRILRNKLKRYGYIPYNKVIELSYDHHLFMQTSMFGDDGDSEGGFQFIITDMMATGLPVLGSNHCDIPEIIKNKKMGILSEKKM